MRSVNKQTKIFHCFRSAKATSPEIKPLGPVDFSYLLIAFSGDWSCTWMGNGVTNTFTKAEFYHPANWKSDTIKYQKEK